MNAILDLETRRIEPSPREVYEPVFGPEAPVHQQILAWSPELARAVVAFMTVVYAPKSLGARLIELVRIRIAFHSQCRTCMATRYQESGVTEDLVCSLERPQEADDLTEAERAALAFADLMATNHLAITDETFESLHQHFTPRQVVELDVLCGATLGMGRVTASFDIVEDLPARFQENRGTIVTPWGEGGVLAGHADEIGKSQHADGVRAS